MGLEDGASPHSGRGSYLHGSASPPPYLSSHSPTPMGGSGGTNSAGIGGSGGHQYASYADNIVYTSLGGAGGGGGGGSAGGSGLLSGLRNGSGADDMSNDSSPVHGYPDFPPSPDSWLGDNTSAAPTGSTAASAAGGAAASASAAAAVAAAAGGGSGAGHY